MSSNRMNSNMMKNKIWTTVVLAGVTIAIAACGGNKTNAAKNTQTEIRSEAAEPETTAGVEMDTGVNTEVTATEASGSDTQTAEGRTDGTEAERLADLFQDGADYITPISENIKEQMKEQMAADDSVSYWLDSDVDEWNFKQISEDVQFEVNDQGNIVIKFDKGDVAPMYMGAVQFEIPADVVADIRK